MNVLIIEDEIRAAKEIQRILTSYDDTIIVLTIIDSVEDAITFLKQHKEIDLIFSDIQLVDGNSFEIYNQIQPNCPIVFCTAFDEFLLDAFQTNALSYILKPITSEAIQNALNKYQNFKKSFQSHEQKLQLQKASLQLGVSYKSTLLVDQGEKILPLSVHEVAYFYLDNSWIKIVTIQNHKFSINSSLEVLERQLDPQSFFRANRQFLINREMILSIERYFSRKLVVKLKMDTPESIIVSKAKANDFLVWMEN